MELVLRNEQHEVVLDLDPEQEMERSPEDASYHIWKKVGDAVSFLNEKSEDTSTKSEQVAHKEMERERRAVERERARPRPSWKQDPGINSPQDYV